MKASAAGFLLLVVGVAPHVPLLTGGCLTDDFVHLARLAERPDLAAVLAAPDAFGFYRPVQQVSYLLDATLSGYDCPASFRVVNLILHLGTIAAAYALGQQVTGSSRAGFLAALIVALAPKLPTIAVFWISARAELLMSVFALLAVLAWIRWTRGGHGMLLAVAAGCYALALLSKETALPLPLVLLAVPGAVRPLGVRLAGLGAVTLGAGLALGLRVQVAPIFGAFDGDSYVLDMSPARWVTNFFNYLGRGLPAPLLILLVAAMAGRTATRVLPALQRLRVLAAAGFGAWWFIVFVTPALPITLRSEIRLYLPAVGLALAAGALLDAVLDTRRVPVVAVTVASMLLVGYQAGRSLAAYRDARFAAALVAAMRSDDRLQAHEGAITLVPADAATDRRLRDTIGGYANLVIKRALGRRGASTEPLGAAPPPDALRVRCTARGEVVELTPM